MVRKYKRLLEEREINYNTDKVWTILDVPKLWRHKAELAVIEDGYYFCEDGTACKNGELPPENEYHFVG